MIWQNPMTRSQIARRYALTDKGKKTTRRYEQSKGKIRHKRWLENQESITRPRAAKAGLGWTDEDLGRLRQGREKNMTFTKIALDLGRSRLAVKRAMKKIKA